MYKIHQVPLVTRVHKRVLKRIPAGDMVLMVNRVSSTEGAGYAAGLLRSSGSM